MGSPCLHSDYIFVRCARDRRHTDSRVLRKKQGERWAEGIFLAERLEKVIGSERHPLGMGLLKQKPEG